MSPLGETAGGEAGTVTPEVGKEALATGSRAELGRGGWTAWGGFRREATWGKGASAGPAAASGREGQPPRAGGAGAVSKVLRRYWAAVSVAGLVWGELRCQPQECLLRSPTGNPVLWAFFQAAEQELQDLVKKKKSTSRERRVKGLPVVGKTFILAKNKKAVLCRLRKEDHQEQHFFHARGPHNVYLPL